MAQDLAAGRAGSVGADLPPLISVDQACELLGISRYAGYRAAKAGDLPTLRWGRRWYVPTARLVALIGGEEKVAS